MTPGPGYEFVPLKMKFKLKLFLNGAYIITSLEKKNFIIIQNQIKFGLYLYSYTISLKQEKLIIR